MPQDPLIPSQLIDAGAAGNLIVFAGAGVACDSGGPTWRSLIQSLRERAIAQKRNEGQPGEEIINDLADTSLEPMDAAQAISDVMGADWLIREVQELSVQEKSEPGSLAQAIARLRPACIITTNYDTVLERAFRAVKLKSPPVVVGTNPKHLARDLTGCIWKIHGDLKTPDAFVLSQGEFLRMKESHAWSHRLGALLQPPYAVLFVGYGVNDPDIKDVMHDLRLAFDNELSLGYWIEPHNPQVQRRARVLKLQLLPVANHASIPGWIDALRARIDIKRRRNAHVVVAMPACATIELERHYKDKLARARSLLEHADFQGAVALVQAELTSVHALLNGTPGDTRLERVAIELMLFLGHSLAVSQEAEDGIATLREALERATDLGQRARAVERLAALGDIEVAKTALRGRRSEKYSRAKHLVQIAEGKVPEDLPDEPMLQLRAAFLDLERGEIKSAVERVIHHPWEPKEPLLALSRSNLLHNAIAQARRLAPAQSISIETRREIVNDLERYYRQDSADIPDVIRDDFDSQRHAWLWLVEDPARPDNPPVQDESAITREQRIQFDVFRSFQEAVEQGNFTAATERLSHVVEPILVWLCRMRLANARGDSQGALDVVLNAVAEMPDVELLEAAAAEQLQRAGMRAPATRHSRRAFELLPGIGNRLRLIECLLEDPGPGVAEELLTLTSALADDDRIEVLPYRLEVAHRNHDAAAALLIVDQIESIAHPASPVRIQAAEVRCDQDPRAAASCIWAAFEDGGNERWTPSQLAKVALIQRLGLTTESDSTTLGRRLSSIREVLDKRFPRDDVQAEKARLDVSMLGGPEWRIGGDPRPLEAAGILRRIDPGELIEQRQRLIHNWSARRQAYDRGDLSAEGLCLPFAESVFSLVAGTSTSAPPLLTPIPLRVQSRRHPPTSRWLLGDLELAVLAELGLVDDLTDHLRSSCTSVLIFQDVHDRILRDARTLEVLAPRGAFGSLSRLEKLIDSVAIAGSGGDQEALTARPMEYLHDDPRNPSASRRLIGGLQQRGLLAGSSPENPPGPPLPDEFLLSPTTVQNLWALDHDLLPTLIKRGPWKVRIGPEAQRMCASWAEDARRRIAAADAAARVRSFLNECDRRGRLERIERPRVELPPQRRRDDWRAELERVISWHQATWGDPELSLVTADYVVGSIFATAAPVSARSVLWDLDRYREISKRVRGNEPRLLTIPDIAAAICGNRVTHLRDRMLRMGFHSAIEADDIWDMAQRYVRLDRGAPDDTLQLLESRASRPSDPVAYLAQFHVAVLYAGAVCKQIEPSTSAPETAIQIFRQLADRLERLHPCDGEALATFLRLLVSGLLGAPLLWLRREAEDRYELDDESPGARFWREAQTWLKEDPSPRLISRRRGAWARACAAAINQWIGDEALDDARAAPLIMAMSAERLDPRHALVTPIGWSLSIVSATVTDRWLALVVYVAESNGRRQEYTLRNIVDAAVQCILEYAEQIRDGNADSPAWSLTPEPAFVFSTDVILGTPLEFHVPLAAVLLRSPPDVIATLGQRLTEALAGYDGRLRMALKGLAKDPHNRERILAFARAAASSPVHAISLDPLSIRTWGIAPQAVHGCPGSLDDLRELLGEPQTALPEDIIRELGARFEDDGPWGESRSVMLSTLRSIAYVPGLIGAWAAIQRIQHPDPTGLVAGAWTRLAQPDDHPAGRLASDLMLLRFAIARQRRWHIGGETIDVAAGLGDRIALAMRSALDDLCEPSFNLAEVPPAEPGAPLRASDTQSIASTEPAMLRMALQVVANLSVALVTPGNVAWMTYRLHQWYSDRLLELPGETRRHTLAALQELDRPIHHLDGSDILLPQGEPNNTPDWSRYRLRVILYSVATMEIYSQVHIDRSADVVRETAAPSEPRSVSSPSLEKALLDAAGIQATKHENKIRERRRRQPDSDVSELPWGIDAAIPDLALLALLSVDPSRFAALPIETRLGWFRWMYTVISPRLSGVLAVAAADNMDRLTPEERDLLADKLSDLPLEDREMGIPAALLACALLGRSNIDVESTRSRTLIALPTAATDLSRRLLKAYLLGAARANPDQFLQHARDLFLTLEERRLDPVGHSLALGPVLTDAPDSLVRVVSQLMRGIANQAPYSQSEDVNRMVKTYGVDGGPDA